MNIREEIEKQKARIVEYEKTVDDLTEKVKFLKSSIKKLEKALKLAEDAIN